MLTIGVSLEALWTFVSETLKLNMEESKKCLQDNLRQRYKCVKVCPWQMEYIDSEWDISVLGFAISKKTGLDRRTVRSLLTIRNQIVHRPKLEMSDRELCEKVERTKCCYKKCCYKKLLDERHTSSFSEELEHIKKRENVTICMMVLLLESVFIFFVRIYTTKCITQMNYT